MVKVKDLRGLGWNFGGSATTTTPHRAAQPGAFDRFSAQTQSAEDPRQRSATNAGRNRAAHAINQQQYQRRLYLFCLLF